MWQGWKYRTARPDPNTRYREYHEWHCGNCGGLGRVNNRPWHCPRCHDATKLTVAWVRTGNEPWREVIQEPEDV